MSEITLIVYFFFVESASECYRIKPLKGSANFFFSLHALGASLD